AIEAGVQHTDANGHLRVVFAFKLANEVVRISYITGDNFGVLALEFRVKFIQVVSQPPRMVLGDGENDGLSRTDLLPRRQFLVILPGKSVELMHHLSIGVFVSPLALEFSWIVGFIIHLGALGKNDSNP